MAAKRKGKTWRRANPLDTLRRLAEQNPLAGKRKLLALFVDHVRGRDGKTALDSVAEYWFAANYEKLGNLDDQP